MSNKGAVKEIHHWPPICSDISKTALQDRDLVTVDKKAVLSQGNRAMPRLFFSV